MKEEIIEWSECKFRLFGILEVAWKNERRPKNVEALTM
jgi:hypothetical protein